MIPDDLREVKAYFELGLTTPLCDLVTMICGGRSACGECTSWASNSNETKSCCERDECCLGISSSILGRTRCNSIMGLVFSNC